MTKRRKNPLYCFNFYDVFVYFYISFSFLACLIPLLYVISASLSNPAIVNTGKLIIFPTDLYLDSYKYILRDNIVWVSYGNTIIYTVAGTLINLLFTLMCAYPLSRKNFFANGFLSKMLIFTMLFSGGLIPTFLVVKMLGLYGTRWAIILSGALSAWNVVITRTYMQTSIPEDIIENAKVEGCSEFMILWKIIFPLSKPIVATMAIFYGVAHWNSWFTELIYLPDIKMQPIQLYLKRLLETISLTKLLQGQGDFSAMQAYVVLAQIRFSVIVVSTVPIMLVYPFLQKYFVKGMMLGSLKG